MRPNIPKKYQPRGFEILYEDRDLIAGNKAAGALSVAALWNKEDTIHHALNVYVRKGQAKSRKCVYVVHRLDQATTGILLFAKSQKAQQVIKENWKNTDKIYYAVVHGHLTRKSDTISSYLAEDEDYVVHSTQDSAQGKLARTQYEAVEENAKYSLLKIHLLTGRKNQIRVHLAGIGHPVVGDDKYGGALRKKSDASSYQEGPQGEILTGTSSASGIKRKTFHRQDKGGLKNLALHAYSIEFNHPHTHKRMKLTAPVPEHFGRLGFRV